MSERCKILIVDDERFNISVLADLLKPSYKIMAAISGSQALKAARSENPPDLILLDVMMPELDGYEVCRQLKADESTREIPVIFVTAMGQESDETRGLALGAADYITKPISPAIVEARVRTQLERKQHLDELRRAYAIIESHKERMEQELNVGRDIQLGMLPRTFPAFPDRDEFSIHAALYPAREVGGDFYDFFLVDHDRLCFCVGDVSGKGVPAALFMAVTRTLIKSRAADDPSTGSILTHVNDELVKDNGECMFVTVFLGILHTGTGEVTFANAGHNPPYIKRADGGIERLETEKTCVVGVLEDMTFGEGRILMAPGDTMVLYTDGVTEAMDPEQRLFSEPRLADTLSSGTQPSPRALVEEIAAEVRRFEGGTEQSDDITLLALGYLGDETDKSSATLELTAENQISEIPRVSAAFNAFSEQRGLPRAVSGKVNVILDELLTNIVSYAYRDEARHEIKIRAELSEHLLRLTVEDDGVPFNPFQAAAPDTTLSIDERQAGGLGIHLVRSMVDEVSYQRRIDGNSVTLLKRLDPAPAT
jgi:sigma-B regulation protein RsbU (phosphoserine phosphatase)